MSKRRVKRMHVFAIESPSALDMLADRSESQTLRAICKLLNHEFTSSIVRSKAELRTAIRHVTSLNVEQLSVAARKRPLCLHIAAHGDDEGLSIGADIVSWETLANYLLRFFQDMAHYPGPIILILSSCGAEKQTVTDLFSKNSNKNTPRRQVSYVLTTVSNDDGEVYWRDSVVAWSIFYHQIGAAVLSQRQDIKVILDKIKLVGAGALKYFRWDESKQKFAPFTSKCREHSRSAL